MAKKKSDYSRMIQLGEWLEAFIAPNISYWQLKKLAHEAINILNIDLQLDDSDLTLQISKEIESLPEEQREKYIDPEQHHEVFCVRNHMKRKCPLLKPIKTNRLSTLFRVRRPLKLTP
ncbi:MAG: hypothetical protein QTN59_10925 [Candidatus Electrothrix communis]|nr:MAG: hypothetical protein QTN59_10925 [Candidatus Electrothrix communis]